MIHPVAQNIGTFPLSYLVSHMSLDGLPLWMKLTLVKNMPLLHFTPELYAD